MHRQLSGPKGRSQQGMGLALSGGGLRGTAHIGVLKVLAENDIHPAYLAGTSAGSIFAALYGAGVSPREMERLALSIKARDLVDWNINFFSGLALSWQVLKQIPKLLGATPLGLLKGEKLLQLMERELKGINIADIRGALAITSTDINSGELVLFTNCPTMSYDAVIFSDVNLARAVRASTALPDVFTPIQIKGRTLVDGGLKENIPVRVLKAMGAEKIVAVDLGYSSEKREEAKDMVEIFMRSLDILVRCNAADLKCLADVVVAPDLREIGLLEIEGIDECIAAGEKEAKKALPAILDLIS